MNIDDWFKNDGSYDEGVMLYGKLAQCNRNLLRQLLKKENICNREKLRYELGKFIKHEISVKPITQKKDDGELKNAALQVYDSTVNKTSEQDTKGMLLINQLPVELHPLYIKQKGEFALACSLKMQLNALHPAEETRALEICLQIEELFDHIEKTWKIFHHYMDHGVVLTLEEKSYDTYSAAELLRAEGSKMSTISKLNSRIKKYEEQLPLLEGNLHQQNKCKRAYLKSTSALLKHEMDLISIRELIGKK